MISDFRGLAHDLGSPTLLAGLQDNGSILRIGRSAWEHVSGGDGGNCAIKRADPRVMVVTNTYITPAWSESGGTSGFERRLPLVPDDEVSAFYAPLGYTADNGSTFAIAGGALYITSDDGKTWEHRGYPGPLAVKATAVSIPTFDTIYVGLRDGRVLRTHWAAGSSWSTLVPLATMRPGGVISDLHVHGESIWATSNKDGSGRVYHSADGGTTWDDRSAGTARSRRQLDRPRSAPSTRVGGHRLRRVGEPRRRRDLGPILDWLAERRGDADPVPCADGPPARRNAQPRGLGSCRRRLAHPLAGGSSFCLYFAPLTPVLLAMPLLSALVVVALTVVWSLVPSWRGWIFVGTSLGLMQWRVWKLYVQRLAMSVYVYSPSMAIQNRSAVWLAIGKRKNRGQSTNLDTTAACILTRRTD